MSNPNRAPRIVAWSLTGAAALGASACGANTLNEPAHGEVVAGTPTELSPYYQPTPPSTESAPSTPDATPSAANQAPVPINPDLCKTISAEHIAGLLHISAKSPQLLIARDNCQDADSSKRASGELPATGMLNVTATAGVYTIIDAAVPSPGPYDPSILAQKLDPQHFVAAKKHDYDTVRPGVAQYEKFTVNGGAGEMLTVPNISSWAQVDMNNGGQLLEIDVSVSPPVTVGEMATYMAGVEADVLAPQQG